MPPLPKFPGLRIAAILIGCAVVQSLCLLALYRIFTAPIQ